MTPGDIIALCSLTVACIGGFLGILKYFSDQISQEQTWREEADQLLRSQAEAFSEESREDRRKIAMDDQTRHTILIRELQDYKLHVANNYVSNSAMRDAESRLSATMEKIAARLESIVARIERLSVDVASGGRVRSRSSE